MRNLTTRLGAFFIAVLLSCSPAIAAYPTTVPTVTDFTVSDPVGLSVSCSTSIPTGCPAHSVLGSVTNNSGTAIVTITGTFTGTIIAEGGDCHSAFVPLLLLPPGSASAASSSTTVGGTWRVHVQGFRCFQIRVSAISSGSILPQIHFSAAVASDPLDSSGNVKFACELGCLLTPWTYYPVPASALCVTPSICVIKNAPGIFGGIENVSTSQQAVGSANNCSVYDGTTTSGQPILLENGIGPGQIGTIGGAVGVAMVTAIALQCLTNPSGSGLLVLYK